MKTIQQAFNELIKEFFYKKKEFSLKSLFFFLIAFIAIPTGLYKLINGTFDVSFTYSVICTFLFCFALCLMIYGYYFIKQFHINRKKIIEEKNKNYFLKYGYGKAIRELALAFSVINYEKLNNNNLTHIDVKKLIEPFCHCLQEIFSEKTQSECSVSIKIIEKVEIEPAKLYSQKVRTILRDTKSAYRDEDPLRLHFENEHTIENNSCFYKISKNYIEFINDNNKDRIYKLHYINNDLTKKVKYKNSTLLSKLHSRKDKEDIEVMLKDVYKREKAFKRLGMEYRSEIVVPILPMNNPFDHFLLGFITVDSSKIEVFNNDYDIPLLKGVSDGLYQLIIKIFQN